MFNNNKINFLFLNIKFYFNVKSKLTYGYNIFIHNFNLNNKKILNYIKNSKFNNMFNFRNKLNFNKSKSNIISKKKTGNSRIGSSSSSILKKGLLFYGFRNIKLKKYKFDKNLLSSIIINKKNTLSITSLEIIKFIYNITSNISNFYKINNNNKIHANFIKNYYTIINNKKNINIIY